LSRASFSLRGSTWSKHVVEHLKKKHVIVCRETVRGVICSSLDFVPDGNNKEVKANYGRRSLSSFTSSENEGNNERPPRRRGSKSGRKLDTGAVPSKKKKDEEPGEEESDNQDDDHVSDDK
jgi:hypothetical protein